MRIILAFLLSLFATSAIAAPESAPQTCAPRKEAAANVSKLQDAMTSVRFITYQPTSLQVIKGVIQPANAESIRADLKALRPYFDGLITYTARDGAELIPAIAQELGFKAMIIGLWTPSDPDEVKNAIAAAKQYPGLVRGFSLGNEIILGERGKWKNLQAYLALMRMRLPDMPLTVTEPFAQFLQADAAETRQSLDFLLVNIHPIFEKWFEQAGPENWTNFVVKVTDMLAETYCGPIIVKETGVPTGPAGSFYDEGKQAAFWPVLVARFPPTRQRAFSYFSAFDAPWRIADWHPVPGHHPQEAYWGLFHEKRTPKPVMESLKRLDGQR